MHWTQSHAHIRNKETTTEEIQQTEKRRHLEEPDPNAISTYQETRRRGGGAWGGRGVAI